MKHEDHGGKQDQREAHSLPGTNQAGKRPRACEEDDQEKKSRDEGAQPQEQIDEHSLPGTNQGGKGPSSSEKDD